MLMDAPEPASTLLDASVERPDRVFPTLTPQQVSRIAAHGRQRTTSRGEVLVEVGDKSAPFFVVVQGELEVLRLMGSAETVLVSYRARQFAGEANMISGRPSLGRLHVVEPGEVIEVD